MNNRGWAIWSEEIEPGVFTFFISGLVYSGGATDSLALEIKEVEGGHEFRFNATALLHEIIDMMAVEHVRAVEYCLQATRDHDALKDEMRA